MSKNWELDDVKRLIVEYKKRPVLWQLNQPAYGKKGPRAKAMKELTEIFVGRSKFCSPVGVAEEQWLQQQSLIILSSIHLSEEQRKKNLEHDVTIWRENRHNTWLAGG